MPKRSNFGRMLNPRVVALAYDGLCTFEFACAAEIFGLPRPEFGSDWYQFETCAVERRPVHGQYGLRLRAGGGLDSLATAGTIIVPGWKGVDVPAPAVLQDALRAAHARGARLLSICSGAFVLAATGLLDGKRATTHWRYAEALQRRHPAIQVDPDVLYIDEGRILTSAGSAAGIDLCLHIVRRDHGPDIANHVARRLVIAPHRDGGQAQYIERPIHRRERDALSPLLDVMRRRIAQSWPVAELARRVAMSERTFMRRFKQATGTTPANWLTLARIDAARELLEGSALSIDQIAARTGLGTAATLRHHFRRKTAISPSAYRNQFSRAKSSAGGSTARRRALKAPARA